MERKEKYLKKLCQNPVEHARRMTQYVFRSKAGDGAVIDVFSTFPSYLILIPKEHRLKRLKKNFHHVRDHFDKASTVLASRYAHSSCARS